MHIVVVGLGWIANSIGSDMFPNADLAFLFVTSFGEVVFFLWLLIRGWKLQEIAP